MLGKLIEEKSKEFEERAAKADAYYKSGLAEIASCVDVPHRVVHDCVCIFIRSYSVDVVCIKPAAGGFFDVGEGRLWPHGFECTYDISCQTIPDALDEAATRIAHGMLKMPS